MPRRILLVEPSRPVITAIRRDLEGTGYALDAVGAAEAAARLDPARHVVAIVRAGDEAAQVVQALRDRDPHVTLLALFFDEEEALQQPDAFGADGVIVGPLTAPAVTGACRLGERLRNAVRRAAALEEAASRRARGEADLEFLKKLLLLEVKRSKRYGYPVSVALVAVDGWGEVAAALEPAARTALLADVLQVVTRSVRDIDLAVPFAEERFVVLLPHTRAEGALVVARRMVTRIRGHEGPVRITASVGIAAHEGGGTISFGGLVKRAAEALTKARGAGGDRAESAEPPPRRDRIVMG